MTCFPMTSPCFTLFFFFFSSSVDYSSSSHLSLAIVNRLWQLDSVREKKRHTERIHNRERYSMIIYLLFFQANSKSLSSLRSRWFQINTISIIHILLSLKSKCIDSFIRLSCSPWEENAPSHCRLYWAQNMSRRICFSSQMRQWTGQKPVSRTIESSIGVLICSSSSSSSVRRRQRQKM